MFIITLFIAYFASFNQRPALHCRNSKDYESLSQDLKEAHDKQTAGSAPTATIDWCRENQQYYNPKELFAMVLKTSGNNNNNKGKTAGMLNALIGSCCRSSSKKQDDDDDEALLLADNALQFLDLYDNRLETLKPDIVTLSLVYTATVKYYPSLANEILIRAENLHPSSMSSLSSARRSDNNSWKKSIETDYGITILYDDDELMILNKPSGFYLSNPPTTNKKQRSSSSSSCLQDILVQYGIPLSNMNPDGSLGFAHRLDRGTSGCLVIAKTNAMHAQLISQFFLRKVQKSYLALVHTMRGERSEEEEEVLPDSGTIDLKIHQRPAQSKYHVIQRYGPNNHVAKLQIQTRQGRKHQVRLHCSKGLQSPILLDPLYGGEQIMYNVKNDDDSKKRILSTFRAQGRFCLHADTLSIPALNIPTIQAPIPDWWEHVLREIESI